MRVTAGDDGEVYEWLEDWADVPSPDEASIGWAHPGIAVTGGGEVVSFHPERPDVMFFGAEGQFLRSWPTRLKEGHGITLVIENGQELIWVADPGKKMRRAADGSYVPDDAITEGQVVEFGLDGTEVKCLPRPTHAAYESGTYAPTSVAVVEARHGGNGDVWVADGYGQHLVHRYSADGTYLQTLSGEEGAGRFNCPHAVFIDRRHAQPEVWVADRGNSRIQVYSLDGSFLRVVGQGWLVSPSAFASHEGRLIVAELHARLAVLGPDDELIGYLGDNGEVCNLPGWPNGVDAHEHPKRMPQLRPGLFNSPHGLAADADGHLYVAEWLIGGRTIKLARVAPPAGS